MEQLIVFQSRCYSGSRSLGWPRRWLRRIYQYRLETSARINLIRNRNHKIRHAVEAIAPMPYPGNLQAIRVIREEVDRIEWVLTEIVPR